MPSDYQHLPGSPRDDSLPARRKRRRNSERVRVTRACDRCKKRKIKCNGTQPCTFCFRATVDCTFDASYSRGRAPRIPRLSDLDPGSDSAAGEDELMTPDESPSTTEQHQQSHYEVEGAQHIAQQTLDPTIAHTQSAHLVPPDSTYVGGSSRDSPEPSQTDLQGHYVGPASGVSFLLRVQKRLHQAISFSEPSTIFTFGDAPLTPPEFDPSFCMMLPREDAQLLVNRYFDFAMPTYRFLHRPTVQEWFEEFYETMGIMRDTHNAPAKIALMFTVFALARVYMPDDQRPGPSDLSARYFLAAEHQLTKERGSIRLTSVQARLNQCYYLLTQSRINHCWSMFGTVSSLALAIGLNRNRRADPTNGSSYIEVECRRRTFWCAYTLDAYLSAALGRPRSFHDDDIDTELPACVEDHDLKRDHVVTPGSSLGPSMMLAPLAHMKLAQIIGQILRDLYAVKPVSATHRAASTEKISKDLTAWRSELARFLDADAFSTSLVIPIFKRQRNVLNLTYWHAVILTHRHSILNNFARLSQKGRRATLRLTESDESVRLCLEAVMNTVDTIHDMSQNRQMFRAFWITTYFAFNATVLLYIWVIQQRAAPEEEYAHYMQAATRCQAHLSAVAEKGSLSERYYLVLEELRNEVLRQTRRQQSSLLAQRNGQGWTSATGDDTFQSTTLSVGDSPEVTTSQSNLVGPGGDIDFNGMPISAFSDYNIGWGQFASMVSSGLGNLDTFLNDDNTMSF